MAFEVYKMGKLGDRLEGEAYDWVSHQIKETYNLELTENEYGYEEDVVPSMTEEMVKEIEEYLENKNGVWIEGYCQMALQSIIDRWYDEYDTTTNEAAQDEIASSTGKVPDSPPCMSDAPSEADSMGKLHNENDIMPDGYPRTFKPIDV